MNINWPGFMNSSRFRNKKNRIVWVFFITVYIVWRVCAKTPTNKMVSKVYIYNQILGERYIIHKGILIGLTQQ